MGNFKKVQLFLCLISMQLLWYANAFAQTNFTLKGQVIGADSKPLSGVSVTVKGTKRGPQQPKAVNLQLILKEEMYWFFLM